MTQEHDFSGLSDEELKARAEELLEAIQDIDTSLGNTNKTTPDGERLSHAEWNDWRIRAKTAKRYKIAEYRAVKAEMKQREREPSKLTLAEFAEHIHERLDRIESLLMRLVGDE